MMYQFGPFDLDPQGYDFRCNGEVVDLEPQVFAVLAYLIEQRARIISKSELIDTIWGGRIVSDAALSSRINSVRRAVGDSGSEQAIIRTYSKQGYKFVAEVIETGAPKSLSTDTPGEDLVPPSGELPCIAVLPFANISGDPDQEFFADGLTEDIITALSYWHSFSIIARNSTFAYKGQTRDIRLVAQNLGVGYVLEGSVRKGGDQVRISVQLIDGHTGKQVWAEQYDRELVDFFALQDEITQVIAAKVEPEFAKAEQKRSARKMPARLDAWECCQRGIASLDEMTKESNLRARDYYHRAISLDPILSRTHSGMAYALFRFVMDGHSEAQDDDRKIATEYANQAIALDDGDATAHMTLAMGVLYFTGDYELAIRESRRALELNPNFAQVRVPLGNALNFLGQAKDGIRYLHEVMRLNPDDVRGSYYRTYLAEAYLNNREYEEAAHWAREGLGRKRKLAYAHLILAAALGYLGDTDDAKVSLDLCLEITPGYVEVHRHMHVYRNPSDRKHIDDGLRLAGWQGE